MARWVDNNVVTMVSTVHTGSETVVAHKRRPRKNKFNAQNLRRVWGDQFIAPIQVPRVINDYNYWMKGVDLADQLIAYYRPEVRCRRTWTPLMLHCFNGYRINSDTAQKTHLGAESVNHKRFLCLWIDTLVQRANRIHGARTRYNMTAHPLDSTSIKPIKRRLSRKRLQLPSERLSPCTNPTHVPTPCTRQGKCRYCSYKRMCMKKEGATTLPKVSKPKFICHSCKVHLCLHPCFELYHKP